MRAVSWLRRWGLWRLRGRRFISALIAAEIPHISCEVSEDRMIRKDKVLALVRQIARRHGGDDAERRGSFTLTMPASTQGLDRRATSSDKTSKARAKLRPGLALILPHKI